MGLGLGRMRQMRQMRPMGLGLWDVGLGFVGVEVLSLRQVGQVGRGIQHSAFIIQHSILEFLELCCAAGCDEVHSRVEVDYLSIDCWHGNQEIHGFCNVFRGWCDLARGALD